jgi:nicotinamidase-related amidase
MEDLNMGKIKNLKMYADYEGMLVVVDMQNCFINEGPLHDKGIRKIIPQVVELIEEANRNGDLVVLTRDTHRKGCTEFDRFGGEAGEHGIVGTTEHELVPEVNKYVGLPNVIVLDKGSTCFMVEEDFKKLLWHMKKLKKVKACGCCTDICVVNGVIPMANYFDKNNRRVPITVYKDAVATFAEEARQKYVEAAFLLMEQQGIGIQYVKNRRN